MAAQELPEEWDANEIEEGIFLGSEDAAHAPVEVLQQHGVTHILTVGFGISQPHADTNLFTYGRIKAIDLPIYDISKDIPAACKFLDEALLAGEVGNKVLVHCARGVSRSAAIVTAYLMHAHAISFAEAYYRVRTARKVVSLNNGFHEQLEGLEELGR